MSLTIHDKRSFLHNALYPYGEEFCNRLGMVSQSEDVADVELMATEIRLRTFFESHAALTVKQLCQWYTEAVALLRVEDVMILDPVENMMRFFAAVSFTLYEVEAPV